MGGGDACSGSIFATLSYQLPRPILVYNAFHFFHAPLRLPAHSFLSPPFHLHFSLFTVPYLSIAAMADLFMHVREFPIHDGQSIDVVYTNDPAEVQRNQDMYESMLEDRDPADRFMRLDLEYTSDGLNHEFAQLVAVFQLCLDKKLLLFQ